MNTCTVEKNLEKRDKKNLGEETFVDEQSNLKISTYSFLFMQTSQGGKHQTFEP